MQKTVFLENVVSTISGIFKSINARTTGTEHAHTHTRQCHAAIGSAQSEPTPPDGQLVRLTAPPNGARARSRARSHLMH